MESQYKEFRKDGFPLCPVCEEDELYSLLMINWNGEGERPTLEQMLASEMQCYNCNFNSEFHKQIKKLEKQIESTRDSERLTAKDFGIIINT